MGTKRGKSRERVHDHDCYGWMVLRLLLLLLLLAVTLGLPLPMQVALHRSRGTPSSVVLAGLHVPLTAAASAPHLKFVPQHTYLDQTKRRNPNQSSMKRAQVHGTICRSTVLCTLLAYNG